AVRDAVVKGVRVRNGEVMARDPVEGIVATGHGACEALTRGLLGVKAVWWKPSGMAVASSSVASAQVLKSSHLAV
ncbi:MAG: hypothetical protein ACKOC3_01285, partial [Candidatus Limnocylindrus sp.]